MTMPTYEVFIDGKPRKIELSKTTEKTFTTKVDDKQVNVQLQTDRIGSEEPFTIQVDDKTYHVNLQKIEREKTFIVKVEEAPFKVEVKTPAIKTSLTTFAPTPTAPATRKSTVQREAIEGAVTAPMTGKIISVKVRRSDQVKQNQVLCVIEAMKMENEITAPKAGTIQEVNVSEGASVSEGETLFIIN
jgi:glutaconyl-CoA decarboxylase